MKNNSNAGLANNVETVHTVQFDLEIELSSSSNGVFSISPAMGCETVDVDFTIDNPINYTPIAGLSMVKSTSTVSQPIAGEIRSEEHTSELQSRPHLVCRLL